MNEAPDPRSVMGPVVLGIAAIVLVLIVAVAWGFTSQIAGAVIASGQVDVAQMRQKIQHSTGGVVAQVHVQEGSKVESGAILLRLDTRQAEAELMRNKERIFEIKVLRGYYDAVAGGKPEIVFDAVLFKAPQTTPQAIEFMVAQQALRQAEVAKEVIAHEQSKRQQAQLEAQRAGLLATRRSVAERLALIALDLSDQTSLFDRGLTAAVQVRALRRENVRLQGVLEELAFSITRVEEQLREKQADDRRRRAIRRQDALAQLQALHREEAALLFEAAVLAAQIEGMTLRAPTAGIVHDLQVHSTARVIRAAEPLMYLIPQDHSLTVVARIRPSDIADVRVDQSVDLRFNVLERAQTPLLHGQVEQISADVLEDRSGAPYFRVDITLARDEVARLGGPGRLRLGTPVEVFITSEPRTPMALMLKPFTDYFVRAFRES